MVGLKLHLGFANTPYTQSSMAAPMRAAKQERTRKRRRHFSKTMTAEKVGNILEDQYGIVAEFSKKYESEINEIVLEAMLLTAIDILPGIGEDGELKRRYKPFDKKLIKRMEPEAKKIEKMFRKFLDNEEMTGEGIPTHAADYGINRGGQTNRGRQSFIDTGLYRASFRAWLDTK